MGTEQQQEFKSEKRRTGSPIKTVLFTDHSIESWRPKKDRDRLCFARSNITKGIKNIKLILVELHYSDLYDNHNPEKIHSYLIQNNFKLLKSFKFPFLNWEDRLYLNSF